MDPVAILILGGLIFMVPYAIIRYYEEQNWMRIEPFQNGETLVKDGVEK